MKPARLALFFLIVLACPFAKASSGTITFRGAIVNSPCVIPAATWLHYAEHPAAYHSARHGKLNPSCADVSATQSVRVSRDFSSASKQIEQVSESGRRWVTVIYN
ncbi:fimbrial protein [Aquitalea denitrificans]|uniref:fimbrial protein n=1 Tax=Aquitalea denitrificans TaxID=519081 RepID=UPI0013592137|nr:hypothetical protein [Aquitalea denitrificans]